MNPTINPAEADTQLETYSTDAVTISVSSVLLTLSTAHMNDALNYAYVGFVGWWRQLRDLIHYSSGRG
jgi:hypothetical protein